MGGNQCNRSLSQNSRNTEGVPFTGGKQREKAVVSLDMRLGSTDMQREISRVLDRNSNL